MAAKYAKDRINVVGEVPESIAQPQNRRTKRACEVLRVALEYLMCRPSHFVEEISSPDVALSRPGTYPNKRRRPPENEENREAPMTLTTTGEGKERKHDPLQRIFPILKHRDGNLKELNEKGGPSKQCYGH